MPSLSRPNSPAKQLISDLGFDLDELRKKMDPEWPLSNPTRPIASALLIACCIYKFLTIRLAN
jgi:hypothetical protein